MATTAETAKNSFFRLLQLATPPVPVTTAEYDGLEYKWKMLTFRPALFRVEAFIVLGLLTYILLSYIGKARNSKIAHSWFEHHVLPILKTQFSKPSATGLTFDGSSDCFNFSTGRRNVTTCHTTFTLLPRHDPLQRAFMLGRGMIELSYNPNDEVEIDLTLSNSESGEAPFPGFVWGVVAKDDLSKIKEARWDLTFTRATDNSQLGPFLSVMSEFADITENILKPLGTFSLASILSDPAIRPYFRSLTITDQPRSRPSRPGASRARHIILTLTPAIASTLPSMHPSTHLAAPTFAVIKALFTLADTLPARLRSLRPETKNKLKKIRDQFENDLKKESEAEKREEEADEKAAAKRKAEEERVSKLSAAEQKKLLERDRKRAIRKSQTKIAKK